MDEDKMKKEGGELNEDELDNVAAGCNNGNKITPCPNCGSWDYRKYGKGGYCIDCEWGELPNLR